LSADRTFDSDRHQGFVREWLVGYRTQLPGSIVVDASYIHREYRDRPALIDNNQIYTDTPSGITWNGLNNPAFNNYYRVTNNKWNWFVYQGYELTVSKQTQTIQLFSTYSYSPDHLAGTFQPNDPVAILEPTKFANNAGLGSRQCHQRLHRRYTQSHVAKTSVENRCHMEGSLEDSILKHTHRAIRNTRRSGRYYTDVQRSIWTGNAHNQRPYGIESISDSLSLQI